MDCIYILNTKLITHTSSDGLETWFIGFGGPQVNKLLVSIIGHHEHFTFLHDHNNFLPTEWINDFPILMIWKICWPICLSVTDLSSMSMSMIVPLFHKMDYSLFPRGKISGSGGRNYLPPNFQSLLKLILPFIIQLIT